MQRHPEDAKLRVRLEDIRRYVHHGVLREEDGQAREGEERTMRTKEEEEDTKLRERRGGGGGGSSIGNGNCS
jgi:hypothetical protein